MGGGESGHSGHAGVRPVAPQLGRHVVGGAHLVRVMVRVRVRVRPVAPQFRRHVVGRAHLRSKQQVVSSE